MSIKRNFIVRLCCALAILCLTASSADAQQNPNPICGNSTDADIVIMIDRTGSVDDSELEQEKNAAKQLLMDFSMAANPPSVAVGSFNGTGISFLCGLLPDSDFCPARITAGLTDNYGNKAPATGLYQAINNISGTSGGTNLAAAISRAQLALNAGTGTDKYVIIISDGFATIPNSSSQYPGLGCSGSCNCAIASQLGKDEADNAKTNGTKIFTVFFDDGQGSCTPADGANYLANNIAFDPGFAYDGSNGDLSQIFSRIAGSISCNDSQTCTTDSCNTGTGQCVFTPIDTDGDGSSDCQDQCPNDPTKSAPGTCGCGIPDVDLDNDQVPDCIDQCPNSPKSAPGQCGCDTPDTDNDSDGVANCNDNCLFAANANQNDSDDDSVGDACDNCVDVANANQTNTDGDNLGDACDSCPNDEEKTDPGVCGCGVADVDSDGDETLDCRDNCPADPSKIEAGQCGCGVADTDTDGDGTADCIDQCAEDPNKVAPLICGCGQIENDTDEDGTLDCLDNCPLDSEKIDAGICGCGTSDSDTDEDGTADCLDQCPQDNTKVSPGVCGCGTPDTDTDGDGTFDCQDSCPIDANKTNAGVCGCGVADTDTDGDNTADCQDQCPQDPTKISAGTCGCGTSDADTDEDGTADCFDTCIGTPKSEPGQCGCEVEDVDADEDGFADCVDNCPSVPNGVPTPVEIDEFARVIVDDITPTPTPTFSEFIQLDSDGDGAGDACDACPNDETKIESAGACGCGVADTDSDGDGTADCVDSCPNDANKTAAGVCGCGVADLDTNENNIADCVDVSDQCREGEECIFEKLDPTACAGANGFLEQVNIASVINLTAGSLPVRVEYRDLQGILKDSVNAVIQPNLKRDFIINDLGLVPDTYGTVCVSVDTKVTGAWSGGVTIYKPNLRNGGPGGFGTGDFDYALYHPFTNPRKGSYTQPLNTFHLGVNSDSTVANWLSITDAQPNDGVPLTGTLLFLDQDGNALPTSSPISIPDGGRFDFSGHEGVGGPDNKDAVGMARFLPNPLPDAQPAPYYIVLARYFYDCVGATCPNFHTGFVVPHRPGTNNLTTSGSVSTINGRLAIVELNNLQAGVTNSTVNVFDQSGGQTGSNPVVVPALGTRHLIINKSTVNGTGSLDDNSVGGAEVTPGPGSLAAISVFYKLDDKGRLQNAFAVPLIGLPNVAQVSEFNSFIDNINEGEVFNPSNSATIVNVRVLDFLNVELFQADINLAAKGSARVPFTIAKDTYGTIIVQSSNADGVVFRNSVNRNAEYVLPFLGR